jgi:hypothetical protein
MALKVAQTFYVDKIVIKGADTVTLDSVDLYFKSKPRATGNRSGIENPGVTIFVMECFENDLPNTQRIVDGSTSRKEYGEIIAASDASITTKFKFANPIVLASNKMYALGVAFDGSEEFELWKCKEGETIVKTNSIAAGSQGKNVGKYYEISGDAADWKALADTDLKFSIFSCRYANTSANSVSDTYVLPCDQLEHIMYNRYHTDTTNNHLSPKIGEMVFQETPVIYGTITVNAAATSIRSNGVNINFSTLFPDPSPGSGPNLTIDPTLRQYQYIVLRNGSTSAANVDVLEVISVTSNTEIVVNRLPKFSSNTATFSVTAAGRLTHRDDYYYTGRWFDYTANSFVTYDGHKTDLLRLDKSNANSTIRFANNALRSLTITSGGTGYSNSDVVTVYPVLDANTADANNVAYIPSYSNAVANVVTNGAGTITGISVTNAGWGMTSNVAVLITTSAGTTATLTPSIGCKLRGAESNAQFGDCVVSNVPVHRSYPQVQILHNQHHDLSTRLHLAYHTMPGKEHIISQANTAMAVDLSQSHNARLIDLTYNDGRIHVLASKSNEVVMSGANVSIQLANGSIQATQLRSSSIVEIPVTSNNTFTVPTVKCTQVYNYSYIINNDITGERKGTGRALCRHISEKVTFAENRNAEDIVVYCDVYRPVGTNVYAYARLHNRTDQEAFDDKDWTQLELKSNNGSLVSSLTDEHDLLEYTFGLPSVPASVNSISGDATLTLSSATVTGVGTAFSTDLAVNDVIKLYSPMFPENYMVSVIRTVTNATSIALDDVVSDVDLTAGNIKIDLIGRPASGGAAEIGSPFQAFVYEPNSYICRYYDSAMGKLDTYNTFQVKLVLTSNNAAIVPFVHNTRSVGVSA